MLPPIAVSSISRKVEKKPLHFLLESPSRYRQISDEHSSCAPAGRQVPQIALYIVQISAGKSQTGYGEVALFRREVSCTEPLMTHFYNGHGQCHVAILGRSCGHFVSYIGVSVRADWPQQTSTRPPWFKTTPPWPDVVVLCLFK
jgi:hypothetical protein